MMRRILHLSKTKILAWRRRHRCLFALLCVAAGFFLTTNLAVLCIPRVGNLVLTVLEQDSFHNLVSKTLSPAFFYRARRACDDPYLYIVLSDSKSDESKIIGLFTGARYNHVSLSFDKSLATMVSYNGGHKISGPGLNLETYTQLTVVPGANARVFKLNIGTKKKLQIVERIRNINETGSSYNFLGLIFKRSFNPTSMFCSQFVYTMLKEVDANYFEKDAGRVEPMDFLDLNKERKLSAARN